MASLNTPTAACWQTINGEFQQGSFTPFDSIERATAIVAEFNADLGEGSSYRWHVAEINQITL